MEQVLEVLMEMGAAEVKYVQSDGSDDVLTFTFRGRVVTVRGFPYNDSSGGIVGSVQDSKVVTRSA